MDLVGLELGKWVYLFIYLFFPIITIIYLIRTFGLEVREDPLQKARRQIEQAGYWADIALQSAQSQRGTKSLASLEYTIQSNLDRASSLLEEADPKIKELRAIYRAYSDVEQKLFRIRGFVSVESVATSFPPRP